jgi:hypothetical protein
VTIEEILPLAAIGLSIVNSIALYRLACVVRARLRAIEQHVDEVTILLADIDSRVGKLKED